MNKGESGSYSSIFLNEVLVTEEPVKEETKAGTKRLYLHVEYNSNACRGVPIKFGILCQGEASDLIVNKGDYIDISGGELFTSTRSKDQGLVCLAIFKKRQLKVVVKNHGFVDADSVL